MLVIVKKDLLDSPDKELYWPKGSILGGRHLKEGLKISKLKREVKGKGLNPPKH